MRNGERATANAQRRKLLGMFELLNCLNSHLHPFQKNAL
jgi:hypothetical protein